MEEEQLGIEPQEIFRNERLKWMVEKKIIFCFLLQILNSPHYTQTWEMFYEIYTENFSQGHGMDVKLTVLEVQGLSEIVREVYSSQQIRQSFNIIHVCMISDFK